MQSGALVYVLDVPNGIECNCYCPSCGESLIAVANHPSKKYLTVPHFRHVSGVDCPGSYESALHILAKLVIKETKKLQLPDFHYDYKPKNSISKFRTLDIFEFDEIVEEQRIKIEDEFIIADIEIRKGKGNLIIEFANTHFIDEDKKAKIKKAKISCIEIDLRNQQLNKESLRAFFLSKSFDIYWISNNVQEISYTDYINMTNKKNIERQEEYMNKLRNENLNIIRIEKNILRICPKKVNFFKYLRTTKYYHHPIIRQIADGEYWNEIFYGYYHTEEFIYFKGEKIYTSRLPQINIDNEMSLLRNGLKQIAERKKMDLRFCDFCRFSEQSILIKNDKYQLCSFKSESGYYKDI